MYKKELLDGRVLAHSNDYLYIAKGRSLYSYNLHSNFYKRIFVSSNIFNSNSLLQRFFRSGFHHVSCMKDKILLFVDKEIYYIYKNDDIKYLGEIKGSRPLSVCNHNNYSYYGEYFQNPNRLPVNIWRINNNNFHWEKCCSFSNIRHIHTITSDPYSNSIWVTTGDKDSESAIWRTYDNFKTIFKIAGGSQIYRVVQPIITKEKIYFGSDSPHQTNYIYSMNKDGSGLKELVKVNNPVFYGTQIKHHLFFTTSVEPTDYNSFNYATIWYSKDGTNWSILDQFKKDIFGLKMFQYGQIRFSMPTEFCNQLYVNPLSCINHNKTIVYNL